MQIFVSKFGRYLTIGIALLLLLAMAMLVASEGILGLVSVLPAATLTLYVILLLFWLPKVEVDEGGVRLRNVFRTFYVSWGAIGRIDTRWALTLFVGNKKYASWSASAPGRHSAIFATKDQGAHLPESTYLAGTIRPGDLVTSDSGAAAAVIRRIWESKRDQELVSSVAVTWHYKRIAALAVLILVFGFSL